MASRTYLHVTGPTSLAISVPKSQNRPAAVVSVLRRSGRVASSKNSPNDADLASDLAAEVAKINAHHVSKDEAMKKSGELLFTELCQSLDSQADQVHQKWMEMTEDEKWGLVKEFLNDWGSDFHPLSARSVKDMVEEHLKAQVQQQQQTSDLLPRIKKMIGFF